MKHFNLHILNAIGSLCLFTTILTADVVELTDGISHLTGEVISIGENGIVELKSTLSNKPLQVKSTDVLNINFDGSTNPTESTPATVQLINGDILHVAIDGMSSNQLLATSPITGKIKIPKNALSSVTFGTDSSDAIYKGPNNLAEWTKEMSDRENWTFPEGSKSLIANGTAYAAMEPKLPKRFILKFKLEWETNIQPNFTIGFADPLPNQKKPSDRYCFVLDHAGIRIERETAQNGKRYTLIQLPRNSDQFSKRSVNVEIRVDRTQSKLQLLINSEPEARSIDFISSPPTGSGISVKCLANMEGNQSIRDIEILEFNNTTKDTTEQNNQLKFDHLINRDDERWSGNLQEIKIKDGEPYCYFKTEFQKDPLEIPGSKVTVIRFAPETETPKTPLPENLLMIESSDQGALHVTHCAFSNDTISANHPLIGPLTIRRDQILSIRKATAKEPRQPAEPAQSEDPFSSTNRLHLDR